MGNPPSRMVVGARQSSLRFIGDERKGRDSQAFRPLLRTGLRRIREQLCRTAHEEAGSHGTGQTAERDQLSAEIAALLSETTFQLRERRKALYGTEPPPRISRDLMQRAVAYRIQERLLGGLSVSTRRLLERIA